MRQLNRFLDSLNERSEDLPVFQTVCLTFENSLVFNLKKYFAIVNKRKQKSLIRDKIYMFVVNVEYEDQQQKIIDDYVFQLSFLT
jgi:hypothetical protein